MPASAQATRLGFSQFKYTRWTADDGAPTGIWDIAQTPDGYLWLAADNGLYRFDGMVFELIPPPAGSPMEHAAAVALLVRRSNTLWVGYAQNGGVAAYRQGKLHDLHMPAPPSGIVKMVETVDGAAWIAWSLRSAGAARLTKVLGSRWTPVAKRLKVPEGIVGFIQSTPDGRLWIPVTSDTSASLSYLSPGGSHVEQRPYSAPESPGLSLDPNGRLWVANTAGVRMATDRTGKAPAQSIFLTGTPRSARFGLAFDAYGGMWGADDGAGVFYVPRADAERRTSNDALRHFGLSEGLAAENLRVPFADREGNIWFAGAGGLEQFRFASVRPEPLIRHGQSDGVMLAQARDGSIYFADTRGLFRVLPGHVPRAIASDAVDTICAARDRGVWVVKSGQIFRIVGDHRSEAFALPPGDWSVFTCAEDRLGQFWVRLTSSKLIRHDAAGWSTIGDAEGAARHHTHWDLVEAPSGEIAFHTASEIVRLRGDRKFVTNLAPLRVGPPSMITAGLRDIFLGANGGLVRMRDGAVRLLSSQRYPWVGRLRGLLQTPQGQTWLVGAEGISRVETVDLDRAFENPRAQLERRLFDGRDGLTGGIEAWAFGGPQAAVGGDGRLWFLTAMDVATIDPAMLHRDMVPPNVTIRSLTAAGSTYRDPINLTLPPAVRSLDIAYAALSLAIPQRVRFRYHLDGVDEGWIDPGTRRLASYTNLGPGHYRFHVIAANDDGVWNVTGAVLDFDIRPTFVQSWPFQLLCGIALLGLLGFAYALRLRAVVNRVRMRMTERMHERESIARELHDTLLQSVQTLTLRFQLATYELPDGAPARRSLEHALDQADEVIGEGRDQLRDLRPVEDGESIWKMLSDIVERQRLAPTLSVSVSTRGTPRAVNAIVRGEIARIATEAIFNISRHAQAKRLTIDIGFGVNFVLHIIDDGIGIAPRILDQGGKEGHFGLPGMRERANILGGVLSVRSPPDGGTEVMLTVPGQIAYHRAKHGVWARFWAKL